MGSDYWTSKKTATGNATTITLTTTSTIPTGTSITVTLYEDVGGDGSGASTDALGNAYDNSASVALAGGTDETNDLSGFDGGGGTNDYWMHAELDGDGADPTLDSPTLSVLDAPASATSAGEISVPENTVAATTPTPTLSGGAELTAVSLDASQLDASTIDETVAVSSGGNEIGTTTMTQGVSTPSPTVTATGAATINVPTASGTADSPQPTPAASGTVSVDTPRSEATTDAPSPVVTATGAATVSATASVATGTSPAPAVVQKITCIEACEKTDLTTVSPGSGDIAYHDGSGTPSESLCFEVAGVWYNIVDDTTF